MASRIAVVGRVTVSLRRSTQRVAAGVLMEAFMAVTK
jgi:hypothetical protein